jgi:fermentation-respiration switch protein FrsA (DUF1100 family)
MLGTLDGRPEPNDGDEASRESAKVQCVVARAAPADLTLGVKRGSSSGAVVSFIGMRPPVQMGENVETRMYREASPVHHVTQDDPPTLLIHGDADEVVAFEHSETMQQALTRAGVPTELLRVPGGAHGPTFGKPVNPPDYMAAMVRWLDTHLRRH